MAQRIILFFSLYGVLYGQENKLSSVQECCEVGRTMGLREQDCAALPLFTSHICSITQEQCCRSVARDRACDNGIQMARGQGACERPFFPGLSWETQIARICCDCCTLGLTAASMGLSCGLPDLRLGGECTGAARTCCELPTEIKPTAQATGEPEVVPAPPPEGSDSCRDSNCSQLCTGNGKCSCREGFRLKVDGVTCQDVDECLSGGVCGSSHGCVNVEGSYLCECRNGFVFSSITKLCEDIDECRQYSRQLCAHKCENTEGSYRCSCLTGFKLARDGRNCEDINECLTGTHRCDPGQVCINNEGSFRCQIETSCGTGYELGVNNSCQDINECALWTHNCGPNFVCINTAGSFYCHPKKGCGGGYIQDAAGSCIDINECVATIGACRPGQTCINTVGSYKCRSNAVVCARGYHLSVDGTHCEDVNECLTGNVCGSSHGCVNLEGSYHCECLNGFAFNSITKLCEDINECRQYSGRLCAHKCENVVGSFHCSCATGFKLAHDGRNCEDINECEGRPCSQECANVYGSYQCYCRHGYQLNDIDGKSCEDIDECTLPNVCSYRCINTPGSFNCTCPPNGYTLARDGRTCQDIDECAAGTHTCSASEICFNIQGGFRCLLFKCPPNFSQAARGPKADASIVVRCVKSCQRHDDDCIHNPVHIVTSTVLSLPTLSHFKEPEEIALLRTAAAAKPAPVPNEPDVYFDIVATDEHYSFDVVKRSHHGMIVGVIRQVKPIVGPRELVLEVTMNYVQSGVISQQNIVIIHVFISEFWF